MAPVAVYTPVVDGQHQHQHQHQQQQPREKRRRQLLATGGALAALSVFLVSFSSSSSPEAVEGAGPGAGGRGGGAAELAPFSTASPLSLGMPEVLRSNDTWPLDVWPAPPGATTTSGAKGALPTNEWWENLAMGPEGDTEASASNFVNSLPYHISAEHDPATLGVGRGLRVMTPDVDTAVVQNRFCQVVDCTSVSFTEPLNSLSFLFVPLFLSLSLSLSPLPSL